MKNSGVTLAADGYFARDGKRLFPVGVNYWPASCGVDMWAQWPADEIKHDLDLVHDLGLNCIRYFLRWPDFEPELGHYNEVMFERLRDLSGWCAERGLLAHPALVVGFMSGGHFWPKDKGSRNLYADADMTRHTAAFCRRAAAVLAPFHDSLLALDLGNELGCADAWGAPPAAIRTWCERVTTAIREAYPQALIVSGLDSGQVTTDYGWRLGQQPGTDFYSVHTYPVPGWNVVPFDGMTDPFCQAILPFNTLAARAFGPVMVQEFSSILTCGQPECASYLSAMLAACRDNGSNGFLWWCLRDVRTQAHPYARHGFEGRLGLLDACDRVKPNLQPMLDFMRGLQTWTPPAPQPPDVAIYWPREYYRRDNDRNPGNDPSALFRRMLAAYYLLRRGGHSVGIARGDQPITPGLKTLVIAGAALTSPEVDALEVWVRQGGHVLWSGPTWSQWTESCDRIVGAQPVDIRTPQVVQINAFGAAWSLPHHPGDGRVVARVTTAHVAASTTDGLPVVLANRCGSGHCVSVLAVPEETVAAAGADRPSRDRWQVWYDGCLALLENRA